MALEKMPGGAAFARKYEVRFHQPLQVYAPFAYVAQRDKIEALEGSHLDGTDGKFHDL